MDWIFSRHSVNNMSVRIEEYMATHPPMELSGSMEPRQMGLDKR
jgi:hypothetical protein